MFGPLGLPELIFIFVLALLIFGPKRLPEVGRTVGKGLAEFRKASTDLRRTINAELIDEEIRAADPRKIVRDSLRDVKKGLELDPQAESAKSPSGPASQAESSEPQADSSEATASGSEPSSPQTPVDSEPDKDEPSAAEPAGVVARGSVTGRGSDTGSRSKTTSKSEKGAPSEVGAAAATTTDGNGVEESGGKDAEGSP